MLNHFLHSDDATQAFDENSVLSVAAELFAGKGYSAVTLAEVAKASSVSEWALKNRFDTKEALFSATLVWVAATDSTFEDCYDVMEMLVVLVEGIKDEIKTEALRARMFSMILGSKDIPSECFAALRAHIEGSKFYNLLSKAQLQNRVICGNTFEVIRKFVVSSFVLINGYLISGIEVPDNDFFLNIIMNPEVIGVVSDKEIIKQQNSVIAAFASEFLSILFVDLDTDKVDVYQVNGEHDDWITITAKKGYSEYRDRFIEKFVAPGDKERVYKEMSPENIMDKLGEDPVFYVDYRIISHGRTINFQSEVVLDPMYSYGNKIMIAGRRIY